MVKPRIFIAVLVSLAVQSPAQGPVSVRPAGMTAPCSDSTGKQIVFGSAIAPDGSNSGVVDMYSVSRGGTGLQQLTHLPASGFFSQGNNAVSLTPDGLWAAFTNTKAVGTAEEIHLLDVTRAVDTTLTVDTQGCIQPLLCVNCFFSCLRTPHVTPDGSAVLYYAARQNPFYLAKKDGSKPLNLPIYSGSFAPSGKRVISAGGRVVFVSASPSGPTFAASATQVYLMNPDGTGLKQVTGFADPFVAAQDAVISSDGSTIAFLANLDPSTGKSTQNQQLFTIRSDGTGLKQVALPVASAVNLPFSSPSLSGDGSRIAFASKGQVLFVSGNSFRALASFVYSSVQDAVISDDGSFVTFGIGSQSGTIGAIYSVSTDGGAPIVDYAPRSLLPGGIVGAVAGSIVSAYGTNLSADVILSAPFLPLPTNIAGMSLAMNGSPIPLLAISPWQINAQIPQNATGTAAFTVPLASGSPSAAVMQDIASAGPSIFLIPADRPSQAAAFHGATGAIVDAGNPAAAGEAIAIYATGLGPTSPSVDAGNPAPFNPLAVTVNKPVAMIGGKSAQVLFSGLTPGLAGVYQVNVVVPDGLKPGDYYVNLQIGNASGQGGIITTK